MHSPGRWSSLPLSSSRVQTNFEVLTFGRNLSASVLCNRTVLRKIGIRRVISPPRGQGCGHARRSAVFQASSKVLPLGHACRSTECPLLQHRWSVNAFVANNGRADVGVGLLTKSAHFELLGLCGMAHCDVNWRQYPVCRPSIGEARHGRMKAPPADYAGVKQPNRA